MHTPRNVLRMLVVVIRLVVELARVTPHSTVDFEPDLAPPSRLVAPIPAPDSLSGSSFLAPALHNQHTDNTLHDTACTHGWGVSSALTSGLASYEKVRVQ
ncbi:hypothetical protein M422DRAFT_254181 [Sphaerobolus stellatus SS14]|uniref:Secreted protein n=1 Tax=Sphaerobolus stellatus (strain SS14) TaxID=990650 RepID=A0A0C9VWK3_SPHS4|nr:hypothetical protein M422DRAFT_254181 [Sphaerobolus stellatus SS14]